MKKTFIAAMALMSVLAMSCKQGETTTSGNPLLDPPTAPYGIEEYSKITIDNFREAIHLGMDQQKAAIQAIVDNPEEPTFANTIEAFDKSGELLSKAMTIFGDISGSNSTEEIRQFETEIFPQMSSHSDDITLNPALFARIKTVYDKYYTLGNAEIPEVEEKLNHEQMGALKNIYKRFAQAGAELDDEKKAQLRELNLSLSSARICFMRLIILM